MPLPRARHPPPRPPALGPAPAHPAPDGTRAGVRGWRHPPLRGCHGLRLRLAVRPVWGGRRVVHGRRRVQPRLLLAPRRAVPPAAAVPLGLPVALGRGDAPRDEAVLGPGLRGSGRGSSRGTSRSRWCTCARTPSPSSPSPTAGTTRRSCGCSTTFRRRCFTCSTRTHRRPQRPTLSPSGSTVRPRHDP